MAEVRTGRHIYLALLLALTAAFMSAPTLRRAILIRPLKNVAAAVGVTLARVNDAAQMTAAAEAGLDLQSLMDAANEANPAPAIAEQAAANAPASP